jgi:hypothetical protein
MPLNPYQLANFRNHTHASDQIVDPDTGDPIEPGGGAVTSVNGQTGVIVLDAADVGLSLFPVSVVFGNGTDVITAGIKAGFEVPYAWTDILSARIVSIDNTSGSIAVDIKKATYSSSPGTTTSIVASAKPTLSTATKNQDTTLTGWTKTGSAGDWLYFSADATPASVKLVTVSLVLVI